MPDSETPTNRRRAFTRPLLLAAVAASAIFAVIIVSPGRADLRGRLARHFIDQRINDNAQSMVDSGRNIFRHDTFGSEDFWGGKLRLHQAIAGSANGGVGPGLTPTAALGLGLKVDANVLPAALVQQMRRGEVNLNDPATTLALLKLEAVVGVKGIFDGNNLTSVGITCAICHSTVDDSFTPGIGSRLDGWPNRDVDIGAIANLAPDLSPFATLLQVPESTVRQVFASWGPGKFDAELILDGKAFRPDGNPRRRSCRPRSDWPA